MIGSIAVLVVYKGAAKSREHHLGSLWSVTWLLTALLVMEYERVDLLKESLLGQEGRALVNVLIVCFSSRHIFGRFREL